MKTSSILVTTLALVHGGLASCGWYLKPNDCICMNSVDGTLMDDETATCCRDMGLKTKNNVRGKTKRLLMAVLTVRPDLYGEPGYSPDVQGLLQVVE